MRYILPIILIIFIVSAALITDTSVHLDGTIKDQSEEHHGMNEIYVHYYSGIMNFLLSSFSAWIIVTATRDSGVRGWNCISFGVLFNGFVGFGEVTEHFFEPIWHDFFHYFHISAGLLGILLLYLGTRSIVFSVSGLKNVESRWILFTFIIALLVLSLVTSMKTTSDWDPSYEIPVVSILFIPTLILTVALIYDSARIFQESGFTMISLSLFAVSAMLLNFVIILGRIADIQENMYLYIVAHGFQDLLHVISSMMAIILALTISIAMEKIKNIRGIMEY